MNIIDTKNDVAAQINKEELILSLASNEEIIQFNKECEHFTGYRRDEVIHKKLSEILLPKEALDQWKSHLDLIRRTLSIDPFILPIKTKHDQTIQVSWNAIIIKDTNGSIKDICLFGVPQNINEQPQNPIFVQSIPSSPYKEDSTSNRELKNQEEHVRVAYQKSDGKKILFASEKETVDELVDISLQATRIDSLKKIKKNEEDLLNEFASINKSLKDLARKYDTVVLRLETLEKKERRSERNDRSQVKHLQPLEENPARPTPEGKMASPKQEFESKPDSQRNKQSVFSDLFGYKKQHQQLDEREQEIKTKASQLDALEKQLLKERKAFNTQVEEFSRWREKLELLESAIEKRRLELIEQEETSLNDLVASTNVTTRPDNLEIKAPPVSDSHDFFDEIPDSAAIIQRGILKRINDSFATLLGFTNDEIVEKSFFDFIAQDGLADIERYYLDRLKGENVNVYKTVFSAKDNNKIAVEVNIKQTIYNGEKAEIAIVKKLN